MHSAEGADITNQQVKIGSSAGEMSIRAVDPREIEAVIYTASGFICIPMKSVSWNITEDIKVAHGTGSGLGFAAIGGNIDLDGASRSNHSWKRGWSSVTTRLIGSESS